MDMGSSERFWRGKVAVVTGGASGIGLALARRFATEGMAVAILDRHAERLQEASETLRSFGSATVLARAVDVTDATGVAEAAAEIADVLGPVHVLCNNAGVIRPGTAWELTGDDWDAVMAVNVRGVVNGLRAFVPAMLAHGENCHVVNTASVAGLFSAPSAAAYCVSKSAVIALSESLAVDVAQIPGCRLRVSVLCPGSAATNLFLDEVDRRGSVTLGGTSDSLWAERASPDRADQMSPDVVAEATWHALQDGTFWVLRIQTSMREAARSRVRDLDAALSSTAPVDGGVASDGVLARYYERVDGPEPASALELVANTVEFCLARPERRIEGSSSDALAAYITERKPLTHRLLRRARDGDVELALGESVDGTTPLGSFIAAMRTDSDGHIDRYLAAFYPDRHITDEVR
jgi:NAD(P)-dependent dehydrogenase (short-subunit alcohol dehydrogenase family)